MINFDSLNPEYFDLDTGDIWMFEKEYFFIANKDFELARWINIKIEEIKVEKSEPDFGSDLYDHGTEDDKDYYSREMNRYLKYSVDPEGIFVLDFFFHNHNCYSYSSSLIIEKDQVSYDTFQFFFALKLRQYQYSLVNVEKFLAYQKKTNFKNDVKLFSDFLILLLKQYPDLFFKELIELVDSYLRRKGKIPYDTVQIRSFLLYEYEKNGDEYFTKNIIGITDTFTALKDEKFIHSSTKLPQFKNILSFKIIKPEERIKWIGRNIELKWMIQILLDEIKLIKPPITSRWEVTLHCFADENGNAFEKVEAVSKASGRVDERRILLKDILEKLSPTLPQKEE